MKTIKILGTGCAKCKQTEAIINEVIGEMHISADVEKVEDIEQIMKYDVMSTPAIVVNDKVVFNGRVPTKLEVETLLR